MVEECTNTLVGSIECNDETNTCECGDGIVPTEYHGTDYCQLALLGDSCGGDENNCLGKDCIHVHVKRVQDIVDPLFKPLTIRTT